MNRYIEQIRSLALPNKYTKYYINIIERSLDRGNDRKSLKEELGYIELHHILPKSFNLGGKKDSDNLVFLTAREHYIVHLCATKMFTSFHKNKMIFAFRQLRAKNKHQQGRVNSRLYKKIKPDFKTFVRLYKGIHVKYLHKDQLEEINLLMDGGWSINVTPEFKEKNIKGMTGRKHTEEGKARIKAAHQRRAELMGTSKKFKPQKPRRSIAGENNPMYGKHHSDETKRLIAENNDKARNHKKINNLDQYQKELKIRSELSKKMHADPEFKERTHIFNSKATQKHNMLPQDYYNEKLKPLIYLGFLPTAITKYKLLDMTKGSIKRLIKSWGTPEDLEQFELNKSRATGSNRSYIQFQYDQYIKYFT